jgi:hypothetical protein
LADDTLPLQAAVVARLRAFPAVSALVAARVYDEPPGEAVFPYVSLGPIIGQPFEAQMIDGWEASITVDSWTREFGAAGLRAVMAAVYAALHNAPLSVAGRSLVMIRLTDQRDVSEMQTGIRHGIQRFETITHI